MTTRRSSNDPQVPAEGQVAGSGGWHRPRITRYGEITRDTAGVGPGGVDGLTNLTGP